ncbi:uncharacterized protein PSFLO_00341 [Pseudozyma flocculosa]|uniref:Uncharacterized protein n=1 Tax=Pseudozyma flocculosa TaxID=84751 RepID=A0A5C3ESN8_9BASI|nr:uncharacterized protein PSFLO_00341 [Pseudozyma flocculosa]
MAYRTTAACGWQHPRTVPEQDKGLAIVRPPQACLPACLPLLISRDDDDGDDEERGRARGRQVGTDVARRRPAAKPSQQASSASGRTDEKQEEQPKAGTRGPNFARGNFSPWAKPGQAGMTDVPAAWPLELLSRPPLFGRQAA